MKAKHTPGPFSRNIPPARKYPTIFAGRNTHVAQLCTVGLTDEEIEGNANLFAAAPLLLEACKSAALLIGEKYKNKDDLWAIFSQLINAIAKAEPAKDDL